MAETEDRLAAAASLILDPSQHPDESTGKREYNGVTRTLAAAGVISTFEVTQDILNRGDEVHRATQYYDEKDLDLRTLPKDRYGYLKAWRQFRKDNSFVPTLIEHYVENTQYMIRGKLDRFGMIAGIAAIPEAVLEIASGHILPYKRLQLAAYGWCHDPTKVFRRIGVELRAHGTYNVVEFPVAEYFSDLHDFLACVRVADFKRRFKL